MSGFNNFLSNTRKSIEKNAPTILAVMGGLGVIASVGLASKASVEAKQNVEKARQEKRENEDNSDADISTADKVWIYAKAYIPTGIMVIATEACIYGSNHINQKRLAALGAAYILKEADFKEYKQHVEDMLGGKKAQEIKDSFVQKHVTDIPQTDTNTAQTRPNMPSAFKMDLWWDEVSKRYFYTNIEFVRKAEIKANAELNRTGWVSINEIYKMLGIEQIPLLDETGWDLDDVGEIKFSIASAIKDPDMIVWTLDMDAKPKAESKYPSSDWLGIG